MATYADNIMKLDVRCRDNIPNHLLQKENPANKFADFMGKNHLGDCSTVMTAVVEGTEYFFILIFFSILAIKWEPMLTIS